MNATPDEIRIDSGFDIVNQVDLVSDGPLDATPDEIRIDSGFDIVNQVGLVSDGPLDVAPDVKRTQCDVKLCQTLKY
jgi:hypothetical protein